MNGEHGNSGFGNQGGYSGPIIVGMNPWGGYREGYDRRPEREPKVPPRVMIAMRLIDMLTAKSSWHMAGDMDHHDGFTNAKGQELTGAEKDALEKAVSTVGNYAAGILKVSKEWDLPRALTKEEQKEAGVGELEYMKIACPACNSSKMPLQLKAIQQAHCDYCGGKGWMMLAKVGD